MVCEPFIGCVRGFGYQMGPCLSPLHYPTQLTSTFFAIHVKQAFLLLMLLDISSHWCQMYSTASLQQHHKSDDGNTGRFFLVRWYYHYYYFFGYCCVGAEFTYVALYGLAHVAENDTLLKALGDGMLMACAPACVVKQVVNVFQLTSACHAVASYDAKEKTQ
mmetsp:Transcript_25609/g.52118  ORF Transcript_25609/g.52118 Transcript_25609/m.52118 type:complete len:162 (+) Transcript_25609:249-734(+)